MFYGLSKFIKNLLPKRLFYRALLIVAVPVIVIQLIITIVFFDSLWIKTNKGMTRALVNEIKTFIEVYSNDNYDKNEITNLFSVYQDLNIELLQDEEFIYIYDERWFSPVDRTLRRELKSRFGAEGFWFNTTNYKELIDLRIKYQNGYFKFLIPKDRLTSSSARIFGLWITVPALIMVIISLIFLKNQTRPISALAKAAEKFGKGDYINNFRPSGAAEIRKAAYEFDRMAKRINRHLNQRSEMLSGISHDLRTPLTRLKLQLEMLSQKDISKNMSKDIDEMENMLNDYLQFAKTQAKEETSSINLSSLIKDIKREFSNENLVLENLEDITLKGRSSALKRCLENVIQNGLVYGNNVFVNLYRGSNIASITIDDDGPGIPEDQYKNVLKPFVRLDKSRSLNKSGVGLGLAIVEDVINSHGGSISLGKGKHSGLQVKISLPF